MANVKIVVRGLAWALTALFLGAVAWTWVSIQRDRAAQQVALEKRNAALIALCADKGLEAIDLDAGHTPKCLNLDTGLMTVPRDFYKARGGHL